MRETLCRLTGLRPEQLVPAGLAAFFLFSIMTSYNVIKPIRDDTGLLIGADLLPRLFIGTLVVMILINPVFSALMSRFTRVNFIKIIYRFFIANILLFVVWFKTLESHGVMPKGGQAVKITGEALVAGVVFYIWVSVFNLFVMSIFWALMSDLYNSRESKKVFGLVGAGGTLGAITGSKVTALLVTQFGPTNLLIVCAALLELAVFVMTRLTQGYEEPEREKKEERPSPLAGVGAILKSPYLMAICLYLLCYAFTSSFIYFQKAQIVEAVIAKREDRVIFYANITFYINICTLIIQLFLTGRLLPLLGLSVGLSVVPVVTAVGFVCLGYVPGLWPLAMVEICRSTANYAISRPSREALFTVVSRRERYLSKSFIDTFVYRVGDAAASGSFEIIKGMVKSISQIPLIALPITAVYFVVAVYLGRAQARRADEAEAKTSTS